MFKRQRGESFKDFDNRRWQNWLLIGMFVCLAIAAYLIQNMQVQAGKQPVKVNISDMKGAAKYQAREMLK